MDPKHPIIHETRETFLDVSKWTISKKGNAYIRDHNHTYTVMKRLEPTATLDEVPEETLYVVIVGPKGERKDLGPFRNMYELACAVWPEDSAAPIGAV